MLKTKWDILSEELAALRKEVEVRERYLIGLTITRYHGPSCECGHVFDNQADFAKHFLISEDDQRMRFLNLGTCPVKVASRRALARTEGTNQS